MTESLTGIRHLLLDEVDSTHAEARRQAEAGATEPVWIFARVQNAGRGRMGRIWSTPRGNVAATLLLPIRGWTTDQLAALGFVATLSVADVLGEVCPGSEVAIKWPNDVLLNGAKLSGILIENFGTARDGWTRVAMGIGMNVAHHPSPDQVRWRPTSITAVTGNAPDAVGVFTRLARRAEHHLQTLARGVSSCRCHRKALIRFYRCWTSTQD